MTTMTNRGVILEVQKMVEDWALVRDIRRFKNSPLTMPHILQQDSRPSKQDLVAWFYSKVFSFATEDVRPYLVRALRKSKGARVSVPVFESIAGVPSADTAPRYVSRCATDLINFWTYVTEGERSHGALDDQLLIAVLDYVAASINTSLTAIQRGDEELLQRALRNLTATMGRITTATADKANPWTSTPAMVAYPTIIEDAQDTLVQRLP